MDKMPINPYTSSRYLKPVEGSIKVRIFDYIDGFEYWINSEGKIVPRGTLGGAGSTPKRIRPEELYDETIDVKNAVTGFRAYKVYNTETQRFEILTVKQFTINDAILDLFDDEDWGEGKTLSTFDIKITGTGTGKERRYSVTPSNKGPFTKEVEDINLHALYDNEDPFESTATVADKEADKIIEEVDEELSLDDVLDELA